jgi:hypothetical protein
MCYHSLMRDILYFSLAVLIVTLHVFVIVLVLGL